MARPSRFAFGNSTPVGPGILYKPLQETLVEVVAGVGIGPLQLGMSQAEVAEAAGVSVFGQGSKQSIPELGLRVEYGPDGRASFIEADIAVAFPRLSGTTLHERPSAEVVALVASSSGLAPADHPLGRHNYLFEDVLLALWRESLPRHRKQDRGFDTVAVYAPGYYTEEALQYLRSGV